MSQYDDLPLPPRPGAPEPGRKPLGKLAQSARGSTLKTARNTLLAIGVLTIIVSAAFVVGAESVIDSEVAKLRQQQPGFEVDPAARQTAIRLIRVSNMMTLGVGVLYIIFGLIIRKFPVPITIISLTLYLGTIAVLALLEPSTLAQGFILKIIIIAALAKAVQAAFAYQREMNEARASGSFA